jgi:hypothetical protein
LRVALVTCRQFADLYDDDRPLVAALAAHGLEASPVLWDDPDAAWEAFDLVVVRSPWDYFRRAPQFLAWVDSVAAKTRLVNPPELIRWNAHKGYVRDLESRGVRGVPTVWCARGEPADLGAILEARGWTTAVVKPAVSAGAEDTMRVEPGTRDAAAALLRTIVARGDALVQPYVDTVEDYGERSLLYFDGAFSHAIRKHALLAPGAVSPEAQGEGVPSVPAGPEERAFAESALAAARAATGRDPVYARVDIARTPDGLPLLMELEVIEPCLFLRSSPGATERFATVLAGLPRRGA